MIAKPEKWEKKKSTKTGMQPDVIRKKYMTAQLLFSQFCTKHCGCKGKVSQLPLVTELQRQVSCKGFDTSQIITHLCNSHHRFMRWVLFSFLLKAEICECLTQISILWKGARHNQTG